MSAVILMSKVTIVMLIILVVLAAIAVGLYFLGKKAQKDEDQRIGTAAGGDRPDAQDDEMDEAPDSKSKGRTAGDVTCM